MSRRKVLLLGIVAVCFIEHIVSESLDNINQTDIDAGVAVQAMMAPTISAWPASGPTVIVYQHDFSIKLDDGGESGYWTPLLDQAEAELWGYTSGNSMNVYGSRSARVDRSSSTRRSSSSSVVRHCP